MRKRTCMNDPWTRTTGWGLTVKVEGGTGGGQRGKNSDECNRKKISFLSHLQFHYLVSGPMFTIQRVLLQSSTLRNSLPIPVYLHFILSAHSSNLLGGQRTSWSTLLPPLSPAMCVPPHGLVLCRLSERLVCFNSRHIAFISFNQNDRYTW